jgi:hypothetical protein
MQIEGITWHAVTLEPNQFTTMKKLCGEVFGLTPMVEEDGWTLFPMPNAPSSTFMSRTRRAFRAYGLNDGIVFGFRVDDIEAASAELQAAGFEVLCDVHRIPEMNYAYCHFRGPDGRVYGINEQSE